MNLNMKTKNVACEDESGVGRKDVEVPPRKKLKQARLPFQILSPGVESSSPLLKNSNKRKLSDSADDIKIIKTIRPNDSCRQGETKENVSSPTVSGDCDKSSDSANNTLTTPCAGKEVTGHASSSVEKSKVSETVNLDETESEAVKNSVSGNIFDRERKSDSSKGKDSYISSKGTEDSGVDPGVIVLSDNEDGLEKEDLTVNSYRVVQTDTQNKVSKNETVDSKQDVTNSLPIAESEQSETENIPVAVKDSSCSELREEQLSSEECAANCESDESKQISPKSVHTKCIPSGVQTLPQCSFSELNSEKNTADIAGTPRSAHQNSHSDGDFKDSTPESENSPRSSLDSTPKIRKLTPKQLLKQLESAKKRKEKEQQRQEREKKKAEEKEEKLRQKLEKEELKKKEKEEREEQKRKEKEEKEELKKKEKEEKERKKQVELEIKNEEKRVKDEEKRKKEDKRQAEAAAFTSFFLPKKADPKPFEEPKIKAEENFMPFEVKPDMRLAPSARRELIGELKGSLDQCIESQSAGQLYLDQIRSKQVIPQTSSRTWALSDFKDDILILDGDISSSVTSNILESYPTAGQLPRPKLLQFWENRRPPYWGTWRKKSQSIRPRNPFGIDEKFFDYEVDSDDEWEEDEPGESLHGSDDEKESEDEYEVDNEFFVPHGYLSDEENIGQEDEDQSPEMLKLKLKLMELEFEEEMKQKTERLKPCLLGCIWIDSKTTDYGGSQLLKLLSSYKAVYQNGPIVTSASDSASTMGSPEAKDQIPSPTTPLPKKKKRKFPEAAIPALIKLIHGNVNRREFLVKEFLAYWDREQQKSTEGVGEGLAEGNVSASPSHDIFKKSVSNKIKELATWLACPDAGAMNGRMCWYVPPETRATNGFADMTIPNTLWNYIFIPKRRESDIQMPTVGTTVGSESNPKQLITKFTKKMTEVERRKQFSVAPVAEGTPNKRQEDGDSPCSNRTQKNFVSRAVTPFKTAEKFKRMVPSSLQKGQEVSKTRKNSLAKFVKRQGEGNSVVPHFASSDKPDPGGEECVVLSD